MNIAIIPARGGSKRIPGKNIRAFLGKPIISYSVEAAIGSGIFDEVMVSTDSEKIADVAREYGADVPFMRSAETADDCATTADVLMEVLNRYGVRGKSFDWFCCIYPTAPFVTAERLSSAMNSCLEVKADSLLPVVPFSYPPLRGLILENAYLKMKWPENAKTRSQDLETIYHDSGQFYFVRTKAFMEEKRLLCKKTVPVILSELEVQDIDTEIDWNLAEMKYQLMRKSHEKDI